MSLVSRDTDLLPLGIPEFVARLLAKGIPDSDLTFPWEGCVFLSEKPNGGPGRIPRIYVERLDERQWWVHNENEALEFRSDSELTVFVSHWHSSPTLELHRIARSVCKDVIARTYSQYLEVSTAIEQNRLLSNGWRRMSETDRDNIWQNYESHFPIIGDTNPANWPTLPTLCWKTPNYEGLPNEFSRAYANEFHMKCCHALGTVSTEELHVLDMNNTSYYFDPRKSQNVQDSPISMLREDWSLYILSPVLDFGIVIPSRASNRDRLTCVFIFGESLTKAMQADPPLIVKYCVPTWNDRGNEQ